MGIPLKFDMKVECGRLEAENVGALGHIPSMLPPSAKQKEPERRHVGIFAVKNDAGDVTCDGGRCTSVAKCCASWSSLTQIVLKTSPLTPHV